MKFEHIMPISNMMYYSADTTGKDFLNEDEDQIDGSIGQPTLSEFILTNNQEGMLLISHLSTR